jgi:stage V sporulation protein SpoVS
MRLSVLEQSSLSEGSSAAEAISMQKRKLGNLEVSAIGLGCMSMSFGYGLAGDK